MASGKWRVVLTGTMYGQQIQNRMFFLERNPSTPMTATAVCNEIATGWWEPVRLKHTQDHILTKIQAWDADDPAAGSGQIAVALQGLNAPNNQIIPFAAWCFQLRTAISGRHGHGRVNISAVLPGHFSNGVLNSSGSAYWAPAVTSLKNRYTAGGNGPLIQTLRYQPSGQGPVYNTVQDIIHRPIIACIRTRNIGVGF